MGKQAPAPSGERDMRPAVKPALVAAMLTSAGGAAHATFVEATKARNEQPRFPLPPSWPAIRCAVHSLRDEERRACVLMLLGEEVARLEVEDGLRWQAHGGAPRSKGDG